MTDNIADLVSRLDAFAEHLVPASDEYLDEIVTLREAAQALTTMTAFHERRAAEARALSAEAERDRLKSALAYATMGLGRIHDSLLSNGPKQASGEMTAHFLARAREALGETK